MWEQGKLQKILDAALVVLAAGGLAVGALVSALASLVVLAALPAVPFVVAAGAVIFLLRWLGVL